MLKVEAKKRNLKESADKDKEVIGVVYGGDIKENILVTLDYNTFNKAFSEVGTSQIVSLDVEGESHEVLVKQFQLNPVTDRFTHIDFYAVTRGQEMEVVIPFVFTGESKAVNLGNILNNVQSDIRVICLPKDIPAQIEVDLSSLNTTEDSIRLEDINLPSGVKFASEHTDEVVVSISAPEEDEDEPVEDTETVPEVVA